jgi:peptide/nickel transport system permease protein
MRIFLRKLPPLIATLLVVSFLTYSMLSLLPGDPALQILGAQGATPEAIERVREDLGLNDPLPVRYVRWLGNAATGDLGRSYITRQPVMEAIQQRAPVTIQLGLMAITFALAVAIPLALVSAYRQGGAIDRFITGSSFALISIPSFMMAIVLIYVFAVNYGMFPATGWTRFSVDPGRNLRGAILPALSLGIAESAVYTRLLRTDMIATLQEDFVTMARSKGISTRRILLRHALRPSSFSLMTVAGLSVGSIIGGSVIVEEIFALPGLGRLLFESITRRDLVMVQGVVLLIAFSYVMVNFVVDILYTFLDPRIRHARARA